MKDFRARRWQQEYRNPMMTVFEKAGRYPDIIDLSIGDPDLKTPQKIIDLAFADAGAGHTKYTDPWGDPELREEIARFYAEEYGVALGEREFFVSTAGCVAMYLVMEAILDPGDEVLIFDPYFFSLCHTGTAGRRRAGVRALPRSGTAGSRIWSALRSI
jgi:aspartate/methionine/tyrosine aminotransferase